jgi:hypothetical protein
MGECNIWAVLQRNKLIVEGFWVFIKICKQTDIHFKVKLSASSYVHRHLQASASAKQM